MVRIPMPDERNAYGTAVLHVSPEAATGGPLPWYVTGT